MRYVPISSLMEGMVVGRNLYDSQQQLLLRKDSEIKKGYIEKIKNMGFQGLYIEDGWSEDVEITDVISQKLRNKAFQAIKNICIQSEDLSKPSMDNHLSEELIADIVDDILSNKDTMINLIDLKTFDDYTYYHSVNVAVLSIIIGMEYGLNRRQLIELGLGALLHDIGKMFVEKEILNKKEVLCFEEYERIKRHPEFGYHYLKKTFQIPITAYMAVLQHHERYDGTGYPNRLKGDGISLYGRIICIADNYDALISKRPYRPALPPSEAMEYIMAGGGSIFDTHLVEIFVRKVAPFPIGTMVQLSNGFFGIIIKNYEDACMRPKVRIFQDKYHQAVEKEEIDLRDRKEYRNVTIIKICTT